MIQLNTKIKMPFLWGKAVFEKTNWSQINLIVGANGSGKTLLSQAIAKEFSQAGHKVFILESDRDNVNYNQILLQNQYVREKIESVLSNMFGKSIKFEQNEQNEFIPIVVNKAWNVEYDLTNAECHGLKEIITLLTVLYSEKSDCIFFDEPELHLHPQFQLFFMTEIRKQIAKNPKKIFFLITHSPFFIDLKTSEELMGVIACHINRVPTHIEKLNDQDEKLFRKFLPRFNTYHKQFFFSDNQIFVEGYTDQQMFNQLLPFLANTKGISSTGIIDVGGKDELGVFCKVCSLLGTDGRIITDLDALFSGKLKDVVCQDKRPQEWINKQFQKQKSFYRMIFSQNELSGRITLKKLILKLETLLTDIGFEILKTQYPITPKIDLFVKKVRFLAEKYDNLETLDTFKTVVLQGLCNIETIDMILPLHLAKKIPLIKNLTYLILAATEAARVYILPRGCIEHYYKASKVQYMPISGKDKLFHTELQRFSNLSIKKIQIEYSELINILEKACTRLSLN